MSGRKSKIEESLPETQLPEFFARALQLPGCKLRDIQALASEFGVEISLMSARALVKGDRWKEELAELKRKRELAESVAEIAQNGVSLSDGAASRLAAKVFDAIDALEPEDIGSERGNNISLAVARLRQGDQRAKKLESDLKLRDEQIAKLERERAAAEAKDQAARAILDDASLPLDQRVGKMRNLFSIGG